jgi:hypothetical protein
MLPTGGKNELAEAGASQGIVIPRQDGLLPKGELGNEIKKKLPAVSNQQKKTIISRKVC